MADGHPVFELKSYDPLINSKSQWIWEQPFPPSHHNSPKERVVQWGPYWGIEVPKNQQTFFGSCSVGPGGRPQNNCNPATGMYPVTEKNPATGNSVCVCKSNWGQAGCHDESNVHC